MKTLLIVLFMAVSTTAPVKTFAEVPTADSSWTYGRLEQPKALNLAEVTRAVSLPASFADAGLYGDVVLRVRIDENGQYVEHRVLKASFPQLVPVVERHIHRLRFQPAMLNGQAQGSWVVVPFHYAAR